MTRTSKSKNKTIVITLGDPGGIGPEVTAKALLSKQLKKSRFIIIGSEPVFKRYIKKLPANCCFIDCWTPSTEKFSLGKVSKVNGAAGLTYLNVAIELIKSKDASALVTAPLSKAAVELSQKHFHGHTEYLAQQFDTKQVDMMFVTDNRRVVIATRHIPINQISRELTKTHIIRTIESTHQALIQIFKIKKPSIALCGLNPHAGEGGLIGKEEIKIIIPAINSCLKNNIKVDGPFAADTLFSSLKDKKFDAIIAMYHDQGLAPIKTLAMDKLVNLTIGLPFIRTSPAHGTAFDIAGKNKAKPSSMIKAINLAIDLSS